MKISFVVLHYETLRDTAACLHSLVKYFNQADVRVAVVDNGSKNGKLSQIEQEFSQYDNITFLTSKENLGFARGNNVGFAYAKRQWQPDLILLCNNDLVFEQEDFVGQLIRDYQKEPFDVAGPRIISMVDGMNQNPTIRPVKNAKEVFIRLWKLRVLYLLSFLGLDVLIKRYVSKPVTEYHCEEGADFQLHGACLIFGKNYIERFDGLYDGTFMYGEEDILRYQIDQYALCMKYLDDIEVKHKEGSSTGSVYQKDVQKRRFMYKWGADSYQKLYRLMTNHK